MEIQPYDKLTGWKSNRLVGNPTNKKIQKTKSSRLWLCYTYIFQESTGIYFGVVWLVLGCLNQKTRALDNIKTGFSRSLDGFPTIKISQKMGKANL